MIHTHIFWDTYSGPNHLHIFCIFSILTVNYFSVNFCFLIFYCNAFFFLNFVVSASSDRVRDRKEVLEGSMKSEQEQSDGA